MDESTEQDSKEVGQPQPHNETFFRLINEVGGLPVLVTRKSDGRVLYANTQFRRLFGWDEQEVIGAQVLDFYWDTADRQTILEMLAKDGEVQGFEVQAKKRDGTPFWVALWSNPFDFEGEAALVASFHDITESRHQRMRQLVVDKVREQIWKMEDSDDVERILIAMSEGLRTLEVPFVYCGVNIVDDGEAPSVLTHFIDQKGQYRQNIFYVQTSSPIIKIWRTGKMAYRPDITKEDLYGERAKLLKTQRAVVDVPFSQGTLAVSSAEPEAFSKRDLDVLRDVAPIMSEGFGRFRDLQKLEQRNRELTAELSRAQEEEKRRIVLEGQLFRAQKMEAVGEFTAGIAHNFNNMLQGVMVNLQLAMQDPSSDLKTILQESYSAAAKTADMVRQLLIFSRQSTAQKNPVDAPTLLQGIVDICSKIFDRQIAITIEASDNLPAILGDVQQLEQVLLSLLLNSRDALEESSDGNPTIRLSVDVQTIDPAAPLPHIDAHPGTYVRISVTDNGAGMDAKTCERVFDPFFTTKPVDRGTGLGLSTAYGIVQQHEGWIECVSQKGKGSTFALFLPTTAPMTPADTKAQSEKKGIIAGGKETLLIIDDEDVVRRSTQQLLRRMGYTVLNSADGADGLQTFEREEKIDLILLDLSMPYMSGEEVLATLKERDPDVKVLIMTGYGPDKGNIAGAAGIVRKPFTPEELDATIRQVLD